MAALTRGYTFVAHTLGRAAHVEGEFDNFLANINTRICDDGTLHFTGTDPFTLEYNAPCLEFIDTQTTGEKWRIKGSVDSTPWLDIDYDNSGWKHLIRLPYSPGTQRALFTLDVQMNTLIVRDATPNVVFEGTEPSAADYLIEENTGVLNIRYWDDPDWDILMRFNDDTSLDILVPLKIDQIGELTADAGVTINDPLTLDETLTATGGLTLNGTPAIVTEKCITAANLDMDLVCTLTFSVSDIQGGELQGTSNQYVYKAITGATGGGLMWYLPLIKSATLHGTGSKGVEACIVYDPQSTWQVCIIIHDYEYDVSDEVVIEVYEWQVDPADHT